MGKREIDPNAIARDEDFLGNNAAFTCPKCGKVFLVSAFLQNKKNKVEGRPCPRCGESTGFVRTDRHEAYIEW